MKESITKEVKEAVLDTLEKEKATAKKLEAAQAENDRIHIIKGGAR